MKNISKEVAANHTADNDEKPVDYLYKTMAETVSSADYIYKQSRLHPSNTEYPKTDMGNSLKTIASLIFLTSTPKYIIYHWEVSIPTLDRKDSKKDCSQK